MTERTIEGFSNIQMALILLVASLFVVQCLIPYVGALSWTGDVTSYYSMDESSGTNINNNGTVGTDLYLNGAVLGYPAKIGNGLYADGSGNANGGDFGDITDFTVNFWINKTGAWSNLAMFCLDNTRNVNSGCFMDGGGGKVVVFPYDTTVGDKAIIINTTDTLILNDSSFHMVTITTDGSASSTKIYIDARLLTITQDGGGTTNPRIKGNLTLGERTDGWGDYTGRIDEWLIANKSLSQEDITFLYNSGNGRYYGEVVTDTASPIAYQGTNPIAYYNDTDGSVTFDMKCTDDFVVQSIKLYTDATGSWIANYTNNSYTNDTWLNITLTGVTKGSHKWMVWCNDSQGAAKGTNQTTNRTFYYPYVTTTLYTPSTATTINIPTQGFVCNLSSIWANATSGTLFVWNSSENLVTNKSIPLSSPLNPRGVWDYETDYFLPYEDTFKWNCNLSDVTGMSNFSESNFTLTFLTNLAISGNVYNVNALEYSSQTFNITVTKSNSSQIITPVLWYNGTSYSTGITSNSSGNSITYSKTITLPATIDQLNENKTFSWNFTINYNGVTHLQNSSAYYQNVSRMIINNSDTSGLLNTINYTCLDDTTLAEVNCTITTVYYVFNPESYSTGSFRYYTFTETNTTPVKSHYRYPSWGAGSFSSNITVTASAAGYPQKIWVFTNETLSDTPKNKNLMLTGTASGLYVTFQVLNQALQSLTGVFINITQGGTMIASGYTDSSGSNTFWLNPDLSHTIIFSKFGYNDSVITIYPTQSSYTVTMGATSTNTTNYAQGVSWLISPSSVNLDNGTTYLFTYNITSGYWDLENYGFVLKNDAGTVYAYDSGTSDTGGNLSASLNVSDNSSIIMEYYWTVNGVQTNLTRTWSVDNNYKGSFSLMNFFSDLKNFSKSGFNDFSATLLAFGLILLLAGLASVFGLNSPIAVMGLITALVWIFTIGGLIRLSSNAPTNYAAAIAITALFIGYWIWEETR